MPNALRFRRCRPALALILAALSGCGEESFPTPPDCGGRFVAAFGRRTPGAAGGDCYLWDFEGGGFRVLPGLNDGALNDLDPSLSSDVRFVAFQRERVPGGDHDILIYDRCLDQIQPQPGLNTTAYEGQPAFSHDGSRLAFVRDTLGQRRLRLYEGAGDRLVPLPALESAAAYADSSPSLSANGAILAFVSTRSGNPDVYVYDVVADTLRDLPDLRSAGADVDPFLSPDGRHLLFASDRAGGAGGFDLHLYDLQTRAFVALDSKVNGTADERWPSLNLSADRIAFASDRSGGRGGFDLYLHTRSSGQVEPSFASGAANDVNPWIVWR